jgi:hypothetical protein
MYIERSRKFPSFNNFIKLCIECPYNTHTTINIYDIDISNLTFEIIHIHMPNNMCQITSISYRHNIDNILEGHENMVLYDYLNDIFLNDTNLYENKYGNGIILHFTEVITNVFTNVPKMMGG